MVKNKKGGSNHKKMARKHVNPQNRVRKTRFVKEDGEMYARITKVEGGSNFEVLCNDNKIRLMVVRRKFKGRNKRDNSLKVGTMIMIGLREWQVMSSRKREKVDLMEVYKDSQLVELSKDKIESLLLGKKVKTQTALDFVSVIENCELARYAPGRSVSVKRDYEKASSIIASIDRQL